MSNSIVVHPLDDDIWDKLATSTTISTLQKDVGLTNLLVTVSCTPSKAIAKCIEYHLSAVGVEVELFSIVKKGELPENLSRFQAVLHLAALDGGLGAESSSTLHHKCDAAGIRLFVQASSIMAYFNGKDVKGGVECDAQTVMTEKIGTNNMAIHVGRAESTVLSQRNNIATCALRLAPLYAPARLGPAMVEEIAQRSRRNRGLVQYGNGTNIVDLCFVGNAAYAFLLALVALHSGKGKGKAFNITDGNPVQYWDFVVLVAKGLGYSGSITAPLIPLCVVLFLAQLLELICSPFSLQWSSFAKFYSVDAARKELGYEPLWTQDEALNITMQGSLYDERLRNSSTKVVYEGPFSRKEVGRHTIAEDAWFIVDGKVYNISGFNEAHPGGDAILRNVGRDSSIGMKGPQHPSQAYEILAEFEIGSLI